MDAKCWHARYRKAANEIMPMETKTNDIKTTVKTSLMEPKLWYTRVTRSNETAKGSTIRYLVDQLMANNRLFIHRGMGAGACLCAWCIMICHMVCRYFSIQFRIKTFPLLKYELSIT